MHNKARLGFMLTEINGRTFKNKILDTKGDLEKFLWKGCPFEAPRDWGLVFCSGTNDQGV